MAPEVIFGLDQKVLNKFSDSKIKSDIASKITNLIGTLETLGYEIRESEEKYKGIPLRIHMVSSEKDERTIESVFYTIAKGYKLK